MEMKAEVTSRVYSGYVKIDSIVFKGTDESKITREVVQVPDAVCALTYNTKTKKYLFTKQFRPGAGKELIEVVAGTCKPGENKEERMKMEIMEELGYEVDNIEQISCLYSSPGFLSEKITIFVAFVSKKIKSGGGLKEEGECIETVEMTDEEAYSFDIEDAKTLIACGLMTYCKLLL